MMLIKAPLRGIDAHGSGAFGAPRRNRKHNGIDIACYKGSEVLSVCYGVVTKIWYPYSQGKPDSTWNGVKTKKFLLKKALRYVQVTDSEGRDFRYFYVNPSVKVGDDIKLHDTLGTTQGLQDIYKWITDHFHFEVKLNGEYLNPEKVLEQLK